MGKNILTIILLLFFIKCYSQQEVNATILIGKDLDAKLKVEFRRQKIDSGTFIMTSINIGNYVRHKAPSFDNQNILSGAWYSKDDKDDIIVGAFLDVGENSKQIEINLPNPVRTENNYKKVVVQRSTNDIKKYLLNEQLIYEPLNFVKIILSKDDEFEIIDLKSFKEIRPLEYSLNLRENNYGELLYKPASLFQVKYGIRYLIAIAIGYLLFIGMTKSNISFKQARLFYLGILIVTSFLTGISYNRIEPELFHYIACGVVGSGIILIMSFLPEKVFLKPKQVYDNMKEKD